MNAEKSPRVPHLGQKLEFDAFLNGSIKRLSLRDPEMVTINGLAGLLGIKNDQLTDVSDGFIRETQRQQAAELELLKEFDHSRLTPSQTFNAAIYQAYLESLVDGFPYLYDDYLITPFMVNGLNWNLQYLFTEAQPLDSLEDAQAYIARLQQVKVKFEQVLLDALRCRQNIGVILPDIIIPNRQDYMHKAGSNMEIYD